MSPRTNPVSLDDHDDLTEPDTNITAIRSATRAAALPARPAAGLASVPMPVRSSTPPRTPTRTSQVQVSPARVTSPRPVPRATIPPRPLGRVMPRPAAMPPEPAVVTSPSERADVRPALAPTPPTRPVLERVPAHSERRWSEPPVLFAPPTSSRGEETLKLAARESRHSFAPPAISDSAARFLPWYWRAWLLVTERLSFAPAANG